MVTSYGIRTPVYEDGGGRAVVSAQDPDTMVTVIDNERLCPVAQEAKARLQRAIRLLFPS